MHHIMHRGLAVIALFCLSGCAERSRASYQSQRIVDQRRTYEALQAYYADAVKLLQKVKQQDDSFRDSLKKLREHIMIRSDENSRQQPFSWLPWHNKYEHTPFHAYKYVLDKNIDVLEREISQQRVQSDVFTRQVRQLIEQLHALRAWIIVGTDYAREQRMMILGEDGTEE